AAAFMIDAIGRHPDVDYVCFHHEQSAAMAADAAWRTNRSVGVAMATSGPGATNLLTGIACSFFDSVPALHITGQVNMRESSAYLGANPRQAGFQETKIVEMAKPITKYAKQVRTPEELRITLEEAWTAATTGRMGPALVDVPMDVQQMEVGALLPVKISSLTELPAPEKEETRNKLYDFVSKAERPLIYFGAGVGLAGVEQEIQQWLRETNLPFVSSWNATTYFDHALPNYCGSVGVYGNRGANFLVQNCDRMLVLGSRLDNRQRSSNAKKFAPHAELLVVDVDAEELAKYKGDEYQTLCLDLKFLPNILHTLKIPTLNVVWKNYASQMKDQYFGKCFSSFAAQHGTQSPYEVVKRINSLIAKDALVINDTGAAMCWFFQTFHRAEQAVFTAGGNSPMGYALPAAIGSKLLEPNKQVVCFSGDGGFQLNIQELAVLAHYKLDITIVILNNSGYGIIKQFQDSNLQSRYFATGDGYSVPNFKGIIEGYGLQYFRIESPEQIHGDMFQMRGGVVLDVALDPNTTVEPKVDMGRPINDQFPYMSDAEFMEGNAFITYERTV
ncbi:MAG TPA: thiamine pyrophosphate-binding protein, partial [Gammaproteobacteria bacterium]|nr:thiamine pyrophosphate-binding protein [Gammaproteobacteria bacterium]